MNDELRFYAGFVKDVANLWIVVERNKILKARHKEEERKPTNSLILFCDEEDDLNEVSVASTSSETTNNPFTPKASLNRYWDTHISNNLPKPAFLFAKASQLDPVNSVTLTELATQNSLSSHFTSFSSLANLCCSFDSSAETHQQDIANKNFANCSSQLSGVNSFNDYSEESNSPRDSFSLGFISYDSNANDHRLSFTGYGHDINSGSESFTNSGFTGYGESENGQNDSFTRYGKSGNNPHNNFKSYGAGGNAGLDGFSNYRS
ncbi:hypothetical protein C1H46_030075 [Malus baccata]|uniref:Uncharacterized protein n=1 Tax=Malus baccata TaxID=106549 RepID=A0A540LD11_MALBA|nr:hypothetical protein C1H46_030075 [Malus baccata]